MLSISYQLRNRCLILHRLETRSRALLHDFGSRSKRRTHYEVLGLEKDCSKQEIRDAFIKLSKEIHPDVNDSKVKNHKEFVKINEAYSNLIRPEKRRVYDEKLNAFKQRRYATYQEETWDGRESFYRPRPGSYEDPFHVRYDRGNVFYEGKPFEGRKRPINQFKNSHIVMGCLAVMFFGTMLQYFTLSHSLAFSRRRLDEQSQEYARVHASLQAEAVKNGNELQLKKLQQRLRHNEKSEE